MEAQKSEVALADEFFDTSKKLKAEISKVIIGQDDVVNLVLTAIFVRDTVFWLVYQVLQRLCLSIPLLRY